MVKDILGLPKGTPNLVGEALLGLKSFKEVLYTAQLKFFVHMSNQKTQRWSKDMLLANLYNGWDSPYLHYIAQIKREVQMIRGPVSRKHVDIVLGHHFLKDLNSSILALNLPALDIGSKRTHTRHVNETEPSSVLSTWLMDQGPPGFKAPWIGYKRQTRCLVCGSGDTSSIHVLLKCKGVSDARVEAGIEKFIDEYRVLRKSRLDIYKEYLRGEEVMIKEYLDRGNAIKKVQYVWLERWK